MISLSISIDLFNTAFVIVSTATGTTAATVPAVTAIIPVTHSTTTHSSVDLLDAACDP